MTILTDVLTDPLKIALGVLGIWISLLLIVGTVILTDKLREKYTWWKIRRHIRKGKS